LVVTPANVEIAASARFSWSPIAAPFRSVTIGASQVRLPTSNRSGAAAASWRTARPRGVVVAGSPVAKIVAGTPFRVSQSTMAAASSRLSPRSNVSATCRSSRAPWL